jgi:hypothetical protein
MVRRNFYRTIITQHNKINKSFAGLMEGFANHAVLFDASGGRGIARMLDSPSSIRAE